MMYCGIENTVKKMHYGIQFDLFSPHICIKFCNILLFEINQKINVLWDTFCPFSNHTQHQTCDILLIEINYKIDALHDTFWPFFHSHKA